MPMLEQKELPPILVSPLSASLTTEINPLLTIRQLQLRTELHLLSQILKAGETVESIRMVLVTILILKRI